MASFVWHQDHEIYTRHGSRTHSNIHTAFKAIYHLLSEPPKGWAAVDRMEEQASRNHIKKIQTKTNKQTNPPWNPAPREEQPQAPVQAANSQLEISFAGKALGVLKDKTNHETVLVLQQRPAAPGAESGTALPVGWEWRVFSAAQFWRDRSGVLGPVLGPPGQGKGDVQEGAQQRGTEVIEGVSVLWGEADRPGDMQPWAEKAEGNLTKCINTWWEEIKTTEPDCSEQSPAKGQETTGTSWSGILFKKKKKAGWQLFLFQFCCCEDVCLDSLWNIHPGKCKINFVGHSPKQPALLDPALTWKDSPDQ